MGRDRANRLRRWAASICAASWVFAFLLVPALHLIRHQDDHVHLADGAVQFTEAQQHAHAHQHGRPHDHTPKRDEEQRDHAPIPLDHGRGTLAHFGAATVMAAHAVALPDSALILTVEAPRPISIAPAKSLHLSIVSARGPPAV